MLLPGPSYHYAMAKDCWLTRQVAQLTKYGVNVIPVKHQLNRRCMQQTI